MSPAEIAYRNAVEGMAESTSDFFVADGLAPYENGDFLDNAYALVYHSDIHIPERTFNFLIFSQSFDSNLSENFSSSSPALASLPALLLAHENASQYHTASSIHYDLSFSEVTLRRLDEPIKLINLEQGNDRINTATKLVYGVYTAHVNIVVSLYNESSSAVETNASFMDRMLNSGQNINRSTAGITATEYILESGEPVMIGFLVRSIEAPNVVIREPNHHMTFGLGNTILFVGDAYDNEQKKIFGDALEWVSDRDGPFGSGNTFMYTGLSAGFHKIWLKATDIDGNTGTDLVEITVEPVSGPSSAIINPTDGCAFTEGDIVIFVGEGTDAQDGQLGGNNIIWYSSIDGRIGYGTFYPTELSPGIHIITQTVTDSSQISATDAIIVNVQSSGDPEVDILSPSDGAAFHKGEQIVFIGAGNDGEDGALSGDSLTWISNIDKLIGKGATFETDSLSSGEHSIILIGTDSRKNTGTDTIKMAVEEPHDLTAEIRSPADGQIFKRTDAIRFVGAGTDYQGTDISGGSLEWYSSLDDFLGTGKTLDIAEMSLGRHVISLIARDGSGAWGKDFIAIVVTGANRPVASITSPIDQQTFAPGMSVEFQGTGTDDEDGNLAENALLWMSNIDGQIGIGTSFQKSLSSGWHIVSLIATDSDNLAGIDSVEIFIEENKLTAVIGSPADQATFYSDEEIGFSGSALDSWGNTLSGGQLVWYSNIDGLIGTGTYFPRSLSEGTHTITLTATDSDGREGLDVVNIIIDIEESPSVDSGILYWDEGNWDQKNWG